MATVVTQQRLANNAVRVVEGTAGPAWSTLYWYVDGRLVSVGQFPRDRIFSLYPGQSAQVEVLDTTVAPADAYTGEVLIQWYAVAGAVRYFVRQWDGAEWIDKQVIVSQGEEVLNHLTEWLDDDTEYSFRVVPVNDENIEGSPLEFTFTVVRRPDAPDSRCVYDAATQRVTVSAANIRGALLVTLDDFILVATGA